MGVKFELLARERKLRHISVNGSERRCVNCEYFEQYYRRNRGNVCGWAEISKGYCLLEEHEKFAFAEACTKFEKK